MMLITVTIILITVTVIPMISSAIKRDSSIHVFPVCTTSKKYRKFQFIIGWEPTAIRLIMLFVDLFIAYITRTYNRFSHIFNKKKIYTPKVVVKAVEKDEPTVDTSLAIESVTATKVNELTVTFKNAVETSGAAITVTKGSDKVSTASETWSADYKSLVIKTTANMINGTYKVTVKTTTEEASGTAEVTSQKVTEIKILNKVALTTAEEDINNDSKADDATGALVYYDVLDQYGESMRNSTTIEWSTSCKVKKNDKTNGVLTLVRTDSKAFTYGESIYVTGVHKTGISISETLTVGAKQALDTVEVKGFVKKGTSEVLKSLPAGFKSKAYYLVYSVLDQNGNKMKADTYMSKADGAEVTFVSDNILVLKEITKDNEAVLTLDGEEYCAAFLVPGIDVNKGGEVNITAIANKTGKKTNFNVTVGNNQILKSFTLNQPTSVIADGESAVIPFTALDQEGKEIKNFVTLASQSDFNKLQLNASTGTFSLYENNDGTAILKWWDNTDPQAAWNSNSEDGIDRPVSLTSVVVGGETSNEMIYVTDKAMPVAIKSVDVDSVYVQRSAEKISLSSFTFIDQYGRVIETPSIGDGNTANANKGVVYDNGFFNYVNTSGLSSSEFNDMKVGVAVEFKGDAANLEDTDVDSTNGYATITGAGIKHIGVKTAAQFVTGAAFQITSKAGFTVCADQTLKFSIEKIKKNDSGNDKYSNISPVKNLTFKGVNIDRVNGFEIKDLNTFYVKTDLTNLANAAAAGKDAKALVGDPTAVLGTTSSIGATGTSDVTADTKGGNIYYQEVKVTGKFNGVTVDVPKAFYTVAGKKIGTQLDGDVVSTGAIGKNVIDSVAVSTGALKASDLYDVNSAQLSRKLAEDTLKVTVYKASGTAIEVTDSAIVNTATKKVAISDAAPAATTICAGDAYTVTPNLTQILGLAQPGGLLSHDDLKVYGKTYSITNKWKVLDQYGVDISGSCSYAYKITDVKENADRYADNNFTVEKNDTGDAVIRGAECGDTFLLTISASKGGTVTKGIKITVGGDNQAYVGTSVNGYTEYLVDKENKNPNRGKYSGLEKQRTDALGNN